MSRDPLDDVRPGYKEWHEFAAAFASALLVVWLIKDLEEIEPEYFGALRERLRLAIIGAEVVAEEEDGSPDTVIIDGPLEQSAELWPYDEAVLLEQQLFPHRGTSGDYRYAARGLALVGLHSAFESFAKSVGLKLQGTSLPKAVEQYLRSHGAAGKLDAGAYRGLVECDAIRHIVIHNRSVVDERYVRQVSFAKYLPGEVRRIDDSELQEYADSLWRTASLIDEVHRSLLA